MRVASLIPSATEIVASLGCGDRLVGRSHSCDYPAGVEGLPVLTSPKLEVAAGSAEIDAEVRRLVRDGLSVYRVDEERLRGLAPDLVLTQDQCEVCAAGLADVEEALACWLDAGPELVSLHPASLSDVLDDVVRVAIALGCEARGREFRAELQRTVDALAARAREAAVRPRVACLEWLDPLMYAGNWVPELVALAGGENLFGEPDRHSECLEWPELVRADPDVVVLMPCGFDQGQTRAERPLLEARAEWRELRAVREGRVFCGDTITFPGWKSP